MLDQRVAATNNNNNMDTRSDSDLDSGQAQPNIVVNNYQSRQQQHHSRRRQQRHPQGASNTTNSNVNRHPNVNNSSVSPTSSTSSLHHRSVGEDSEASTTPTTASEDELDAEHEELVRLRCQSICTEVIADRHKRKNRCADYPGLAFGSSIFSSNTLMKFSIIKNELHNITNVQLKRHPYIITPDELVHEKEKYKAISDELDLTFAELSGY